MGTKTPLFETTWAFAAVLRFACMLSLWHAPVPWVHVHSAEDTQLASHIRHFHPEMLKSVHDEPAGWHWHTVLPPWGRNPASSEDDEHAPWTVIEFAPAVVAADMAWHIDVDYAVWNPVHQPMISSSWSPSVGAADEFLGTYLQSHTAQQILSVCLC